MIEPMKRAADMAVVPSAMKRPRTELVAAAQSQQLVATVRSVAATTGVVVGGGGVGGESNNQSILYALNHYLYTPTFENQRIHFLCMFFLGL